MDLTDNLADAFSFLDPRSRASCFLWLPSMRGLLCHNSAARFSTGSLWFLGAPELFTYFLQRRSKFIAEIATRRAPIL
jgi:hypothetical protein